MEFACQPPAAFPLLLLRGSRQETVDVGRPKHLHVHALLLWGFIWGTSVTQPKNLNLSPPSGLVFAISVILNLKVVFLFKKN